MVDTTFEIATQRAFLLCERGFELDQATYDYSLYEIRNFPKNRKKFFRSNVYLNCVYNLENDVLLFHPTLHDADKRVSVRFDKADLKEVFFDEYFVLLCHLNGYPRYEILKIEKSQKSNHPLPYELGFDGKEIFGHAYDSTGFQLYNYRIEKGVLKITSEAKFKLKTSFGAKWLTMEFAQRYFILRVDKFHNWIILYILNSIGREYIVSKFNIGSNSSVLKEIYRGEDMGGRFNNTNLFLYEDLTAKKLKIIEDVELK